MLRREWLIGFSGWAAAGWSAAGWSAEPSTDPAPAEPPREDVPPSELLKPATKQAILRGLNFLAGRQNEEDGAFSGAGYRRNVAVVSLAGMAFLASGSTPRRGPFGRQVDRALQYVLRFAQDDGFISAPGTQSHGPMYDHGFATLFLAEAYGMSAQPRLREKLAKAVKMIVGSQNREGGWRYMPDAREADISVTVCQVMALRAARNAGLHVPNESITRCIDYCKRSQNPDGGFMYMLQAPGQSEFPRSAAGIVALYSAGVYDGDAIGKGLDYLEAHAPAGEFGRDPHYFYGQYYAAQAFWHAGGARWRRWYEKVRDPLLARQRNDGSWPDDICPEYGTAMACLVLQMPSNYLPIFQK